MDLTDLKFRDLPPFTIRKKLPEAEITLLVESYATLYTIFELLSADEQEGEGRHQKAKALLDQNIERAWIFLLSKFAD